MLNRIINLIFYFLSGFVPRHPNRVVFGAWFGGHYADNPRFLFEHLFRTRPDLDLWWIGNTNIIDQIPKELSGRCVRRSSCLSLWILLTSGKVYLSHGYLDLAKYNLCRGAIITYLGHGLTIKRMGAAPRPEGGFTGQIRKLFRLSNTYDFFAASSREHARKLLAEFSGYGISPERLVYLGQPRTDTLLAEGRNERGYQIRRAILERHGHNGERKLVTYMPTFRDAGETPFSFNKLEGDSAKAVDKVLWRHNAMLVEKVHFVDRVKWETSNLGSSSRVIVMDIGESIDTQDLLLATDLLITDYSGCYLDYVLLDRPVLHFAYDLEDYENNDRGLYYSLDRVAGGAIAQDLDKLLQYLDLYLADPNRDRDRRMKLRKWMLESDDGKSCERFAASLDDKTCIRNDNILYSVNSSKNN